MSDKYDGFDLTLEVIKILACFCVVFNHTSMHGYYLFSTRSVGGVLFWIDLVISIVCKIGVPLYFMTSGAVLLGKNDSPHKLLSRAMRIVACLLITAFLYYLLNVYSKVERVDVKTFLMGIGDATIWNQALWYLYAYVAYLMSIPFIKHIARQMDYSLFIYMVCLVVFFNTILSRITDLTGYIISSNVLLANWISTNIIFYPLAGYYLFTHDGDIRKHTYAVFNAVTLASLGIACFLTYKTAIAEGLSWETTTWFGFQGAFISVTAYMDLLWIGHLFQKKKIRKNAKSIIVSISRCTFGIFLIHTVFIYYFPYVEIVWSIATKAAFGSEIIGAFGVCLLIMIVSGAIVLFLKQFPIFRKLL